MWSARAAGNQLSDQDAFLGDELRRAWSAAGMNQDQIARATGFDRTVITKAETGERSSTKGVLGAIAEGLQLYHQAGGAGAQREGSLPRLVQASSLSVAAS
jgi:transcriptional regulator with XRE-family HTH domain